MQTQTDLGQALDAARERTDALFRIVRPDSLYERPIPERHRIVFYLGHLEAFDWNLIGRYALDRRPFSPEFDKLFAFGIDPPPGQLPCDQPSDWPSLAEVERYNKRTRDAIERFARPGSRSNCCTSPLLEHRLMHVETFAYILHQLAYDRKDSSRRGLRGTGDRIASRKREHWMIDIPAGVAWQSWVCTAIPRRIKAGPFGWDNEFDAHRVDVPAFSLAKQKVTNGEYLEFVRAGAAAPFFWSQRAGDWFQRGMFSEFPLPLDWPVYVTHEQAVAYAKWRGAALPTEAQFHRAASLAGESPRGNFDFKRWDPEPVQAGDSGAATPSQLVGNGWEWTSTPFAPFPGFTPFPFYQNYSEPFFDGQHFVLKGASPVTAARLTRPSFRNWFRPAYPYVYATFRLVEL